MGIDELLREKREEILRIAAKHGAYDVRFFGSVARGDTKSGLTTPFILEKAGGWAAGCRGEKTSAPEKGVIKADLV
jgi:hypothetical protein